MKKWISLVLAVIIGVLCFVPTFATEYTTISVDADMPAVEADSITTLEENGRTYTIEKWSNDSSATVSVTDESTNEIFLVNVSNDLNSVEVSDYQYKGKIAGKKYYKKKTTKSHVGKTETTERVENVLMSLCPVVRADAASISWKTKYTTPAIGSNKDKIWYQLGTSGKTTYLKIGCKATYKINYSSLNSTPAGKCDKFREEVQDCISYYKKAQTCLGAGATSAAASIIAAGILTLGPGALVAACVEAIGGSATYFYYVYDAVKYHDLAADDYVIIRSYGTKI